MRNNIFHLTLPEGWDDKTLFTFQGPDDSGVRHNLVLVIDSNVDKALSLEAFANQQMDNARQFLPGFEMIHTQERILMSGYTAYEVVYKYIPSDNRILFQKQYFLIIETKGYIFTATFSKKTLKTIANEVDAIIASFKPDTLGEKE